MKLLYNKTLLHCITLFKFSKIKRPCWIHIGDFTDELSVKGGEAGSLNGQTDALSDNPEQHALYLLLFPCRAQQMRPCAARRSSAGGETINSLITARRLTNRPDVSPNCSTCQRSGGFFLRRIWFYISMTAWERVRVRRLFYKFYAFDNLIWRWDHRLNLHIKKNIF